MTISRLVAFALTLTGLPLITLAASDSNCGVSGGLTNPISTCDLWTFFADLLRLVARIMFPIIVLFIVYIGFLFVTSADNPEGIKKARNYLLWAVVGALLILGAEALSYAIKATVDQF